MKKYFSAAVIISLLFISCTKDAAIETDISKPVIKVVYPLDVPQLPQGYPLCMRVQISDNKTLSTVWLQINDTQGYGKDYPVAGKSIEITEKYLAPAGISGDFIAIFSATDETGNTSSKEIRFVINN